MRSASGSSLRRGGLDPVRIRPHLAPTLSEGLRLALAAKGAADAENVDEALARGDVLSPTGRTLTPADPWMGEVLIYRPIPDEMEIDLAVLQRGEDWLAIDKPAGIATTPQGSYVARSVLVQARRQFGEVAPVHRLDRATSGVLLLAGCAEARRSLARQFADGNVTKTYELLAPAGKASYDIDEPVREGQRRAEAATSFRMLERRGDIARYEARPTRGRMHQIRQHAALAGIPILGDGRYGAGDRAPDRIELLAREVCFIGPYCGQMITVASRQKLHWPL